MTPTKPQQGFAWNPYVKYPRNELCYCQSGKKYKKCCLLTEPMIIPKHVEKATREMVREIRGRK